MRAFCPNIELLASFNKYGPLYGLMLAKSLEALLKVKIY